MTDYTPDRWVIAKITTKEDEPLYKVFGTWIGGYLDGDRWRMNSGISEVKSNGEYFEFYGYSGSMYRCHKDHKDRSFLLQGPL